jgi:hypothetical protein
MNMNYRDNPDAACVARARALLAAAAKGVEQLENAAHQAFCRLAALAGMLTRLEELAESPGPEAGEAAALDAATVCREAKALLRYMNSNEWPAGRVAANGRGPGRSPARTGTGVR